MPRFFFHFSDHQHSFRDDEGLDLANGAAARISAREAAQALIVDLRDEIADWSAWRVEVADERGRTVAVLPLYGVHCVKRYLLWWMQSAGRNRDWPRCCLDGARPLHLVSGRPSKEA